MKLTDTHAHLDKFANDGTLADVLARARAAGVERIITCATTPHEWKLYREIASENAGVFWQAGIHPTEIADGDDTALDALPALFLDDPFAPVAIGEIGLDYHFLPDDPAEAEKAKSRQREIFARQLRIATDLGKKVCVHARDSLADCIAEIERAKLDFSNVVFHCFAGTPQQLRELNERGARGSFTGIITYKSAGEMREAMLAQGLEKLMLETDCPYLAPAPHRGKTCEPWMVSETAKAAAELFGVSAECLAEQTEQNVREFFNAIHL